jgi:hypothetical protein
MPLTAKGAEIKSAMEKTYGSEKKAEQVLYASKNAGKITGIDSSKLDALCDAAETFGNRANMMCDDHRVIGGVQIQPNASQIENTLGMRFDAALCDVYLDEWSEEAREAALKARQANTPAKADPSKQTKISRGELDKKLGGMSNEKLNIALAAGGLDKGVKKAIEEELDKRTKKNLEEWRKRG